MAKALNASQTLKRVGHKGAEAVVAGNTLESFDAAIELGVDMIEFDVLPELGTGRLLVAHDHKVASEGNSPELATVLSHLASKRFKDVEFNLDLKRPGYELPVITALKKYGLVTRTLISSHYAKSISIIRKEESTIKLGWSVPRPRRDYDRFPLTDIPVIGSITKAIALFAKWQLPARVHRVLKAGHCDAIMAHWLLVTPALIEAIQTAGGELYVWTVDDPVRMQRLAAMGIDGLISNDPRLFLELEDRAGHFAEPHM